MKQVIQWYDYIPVNAYWFALTARSQVLAPLVIPLLVQQFVGEGAKGAYLGMIRLWALMVAVLIQALMGLLSDRSRLRWGRRRPFIVAGALGELGVMVLIGFTTGLEGTTGYWTLFGLYILSMTFSNTAHAATQGLIPDLVPQEARGRFSGVKALLELPLPLIFVSLVVGRLVSAGNLWGALISVMAVILVGMLVTLLVREERFMAKPAQLDWQPILRLLMMTGAFATIILAIGAAVKGVVGLSADLSTGVANTLTWLAGLLGMSIATALGVWVSICVGTGQDVRQVPSFTWWVINRLAFLVPATNLAGFMLFFLQDRFPELSGEKAAGPATTIAMLIGVLLLLTVLPSGWLADSFGKKPLIAISGLLAAGATFIVVVVTNLTAIYVGGGLIGVAVGLFYSSNWALGTGIVPRDQAGRFLGLSNLAGAGAGAIGAYIGGPIADSAGYVLLFSIYGALFVLSVLALRGIEETQGT